jgi:hypothetical protein
MPVMREGSGSRFEPRLLDQLLGMLPHILVLKAEWYSR